MAGVAARERKRLASAAACIEVGRITFSGTTFGGEHVMILRMRDQDGETHMLPEIDGKAFRTVTMRGLRTLVTRRIMQTGRAPHNEAKEGS